MRRAGLYPTVMLPILWLSLGAVGAPEQADEKLQYLFPDETSATPLAGWRIHAGDSASWSDTAYNDAHWTVTFQYDLWRLNGYPGTGVFWYRKAVFIPELLDSLEPLALYQVAAVSACQLFWDGRLIGRNGSVGCSLDAEAPGRSGAITVIPRALAGPGKHTLCLRVSNQHTFSGLVQFPLQIGYLSSIHEWLFGHGATLAFLAGVFLFTALFHIAVLVGYRDRWPYAVFSAFCISCAVYILVQIQLRHLGISLSNYYLLATVNDIPWFLMMTLLPIFFLLEFSFPKREWVIVAIALAALPVVLLPRLVTLEVLPAQWLRSFDAANRFHSYLTLVISAAVAFWALLKRKTGCLSSSAGLLAFAAGVYVTYRMGYDYGWALGFAVLILFLTLSLSNQMAQRNRERQEFQLRSTRLELELLKKHIQPHFLLNSLNSIIAWLEEDPATAAKLVNDLAEELRLLLRFAHEKQVALSEEIRLCRTHLRVMGLRYGKSFEFNVEEVAGNEQIPPLIIHTLVENGLTHGYAGKDAGTFALRRDDTPRRMRLTLFNDSSGVGADVAVKDGTGFRYVKSRLEEMFPGRWKLSAGPVPGGWQVTLDIRRKAA